MYPVAEPWIQNTGPVSDVPPNKYAMEGHNVQFSAYLPKVAFVPLTNMLEKQIIRITTISICLNLVVSPAGLLK